MNDKRIETPKVHPELKRLFQPAANDVEQEGTSSNLPLKTTIHTWKGYALCAPQDYAHAFTSKVPVSIVDHDFEDLNAAASFICSAQMLRTDLTKSYRKYLIGKKFDYEKAIFHKENPNLPNAKYRVAYKIGEAENISGGTVLKYNAFSTAIDIICKNTEELGQYLLMEKIKVSHENTIELSRLTADEVRYVSKAAIKQRLKHLTFQDIRHECEWKHTNSKSSVSRTERREQKDSSLVSIRQMPAYNPDADVNSLCMTIDSWVSSIKRVNQNVDFSTITRKATINLVRQLTILEQTISVLQKSLAERDTQ